MQDTTMQDKTMQDKTMQDTTMQDTTMQGKGTARCVGGGFAGPPVQQIWFVDAAERKILCAAFCLGDSVEKFALLKELQKGGP